MKFSCLQVFTAVLSVIVPVVSVYGDEPLESSSMSVLVVSATRSEQTDLAVPADITVIDAEEIRRSGAAHVADVLRNRGLLQVRDLFGDGSRASVDMRGFGESAAANTLILVDGRRLNNADRAGPDLNSIALQNVERIEIVQGSSGALFGDQAVGGVINIITRQPQAFSANIAAGSGSYGRRQLQGQLADRLENGLAYSVGVMDRSADNYREHNQQDYQNMLGRVDYAYTQGGIFLEWQHVQEGLQTPGALLASEVALNRRQSIADFSRDFSNTETDVKRVGVRQSLSEHWSFLMEGVRREGDGDFLLNFRGCLESDSCNVRADSDHREQQSWTPSVVGEYTLAAGKAVVTAGVDQDKYRYLLNSVYVTTRNTRDVSSVYMQAVLPLRETLVAAVGLRQVDMRDDLVNEDAFSQAVRHQNDVQVKNVGVLFLPSADFELFARYDENYRFAAVEEQAYTVVGVVGLKVQEGESTEFGIGWEVQGLRLKLVATRLGLRNEIAFDPTANGPYGPFGGANVNFDKTRRNTRMLEFTYDLNDNWGLDGSYSAVDATFRSGIFAGKDVSGVANSIARLAARYQFSDSWDTYLEWQGMGAQYALGDNGNFLDKRPGYTLVNANVTYHKGPWQLAVRINNLTDREYIESANAYGALQPSPGRNAWLTLRTAFGSSK